MASEIVRAAISSVPSLPECAVNTPKTISTCDKAQQLITAVAKEENLDIFDTFADALLLKLHKPLTVARATCSSKSVSLVREKMWIEYQDMRSTTLVALWDKFFVDINCTHLKDHMLIQLINQLLFESIITEQFTKPKSIQPCQEHSLSGDEQNILRYACGFVPMRLIHRFSKQQGCKAASFVECLSHMAVDGPQSSFHDYTREWTIITNRGGLYEVNDCAFQLFVTIELALGEKLKAHLQQDATAV